MEFVPQLVPVPPAEPKDDSEEGENFIGGVIIVGGTKIVLFEMAKGQTREDGNVGKKRRVDNKQGNDAGKDRAKEVRKRKPKASVEWPWGEVTACLLYPFVSGINAQNFF